MKQLRFSELIKSAGAPQTVALWDAPKRNRPLMKAVRENRVSTVVQKPAGQQKDFGRIGFHQQPFATYLIFPKILPRAPDAKIVGVQYDRIQEPAIKTADQALPASRPVAAREKRREPERDRASVSLESLKKQRVEPVEKQYEIVVVRTAVVRMKLKVSAPTQSSARAKALALAQSEAFKPDATEIRDVIKSVETSPARSSHHSGGAKI